MPRRKTGYRLSDRPNESGFYEIRWSEGRRSKRRSTGCADRGEAEQVFAHFLLLKDREDPGAALPISAMLDFYAREHVVRVNSKLTAELAIAHLKAHFGELCITKLMPAEVARYVKARKAGAVSWLDLDTGETRGGRKCGDSGIRRELSVLTAAANFAVRKGELSKNDVPVIELPPASEPRDRWLTDDEVAALFDAARARRDGRLSRAERFLWLAYYTAARKGALLDLRWPQVDFDTKVIHLNPPGRKQTKKRRASVPIADDLLAVLRQAHKERSSEYVLDHGGSIRRGFGTLVKAAGLKGVTPHTLRHTAATHMARAGVDLWIIANVLGDTLATTEKNYAHHNPDFARRGVSALNRRVQAI